MDSIAFLEQKYKQSRKNPYIFHIEQIASHFGNVKLVKKIFKQILNKITDESFPLKITQKIDGIPIIFGHTRINGRFIGLRNKCIVKGKIKFEELFFTPEQVKQASIEPRHKELLLKCFEFLLPKTKKNTIYFGEILFSNKSEIKSEKNKKKFIVAQPNLFYYKIYGVKKQHEFGILEIGMKKNISDILDFDFFKLNPSKWDFKSSKIFITDGKIEIHIDKNDKIIQDLLKRIDSLPDKIEKNIYFKPLEYYLSDHKHPIIDEISAIKEEILKILKTKKNIIGLKGIETNEEVDEGIVIKTADYDVKLVSKDFFIFTKEKISNENFKDKVRGKDLSSFVVLFVGRFQPFHKGHFNAFKELEKKFKKVLLITSNYNANEPLNFEEKKALIVGSGIKAEKVKMRPEHLKMYSFEMAKYFTNLNTEIAVYAISEKDRDRLRETERNKIVEVESENDFEKAKQLLLSTLNAPREEKIHYTFVTFPKSLKENDMDLNATKLRIFLRENKSIQKYIPYDEKKFEKILSKFKN